MSNQYDWSPQDNDTVVDVLRRAALKWGDKPFIDIMGEIYTFRDLDQQSNRIARGLIALGIKPGECVTTIIDNNFDAVCLWFGINKAGATSVAVNTACKGEFLRHQLADTGTRVIIAEEDYAHRVIAIEDKLPQAETLVCRAPNAVSSKHLKTVTLDEMCHNDYSDPMIPIKPTDLTTLVYTGGTTGPSKGCMNSHTYVCGIARQAIILGKRHIDTVNWTPLPLFHQNATATSILAQMMVGGRVALYTRFSVSNFWSEIERTGANDVNILGAMVPMLANAPDNDAMLRCKGQIKTLNAVPLPLELKSIWKERFGVRDFGGGYGLTEATMITLQEAIPDAPEGTSGKRNEWFDVRIVDDNDNELTTGEAGEVIVRPLKPHCMFEGYWNRPKETLKVFKNLWFHTGDIGKFDKQGYFYFLDRKKDYLRRRGENISSQELEATFLGHPAIADVAVHAVLSNLTEDDVKVTAVLKNNSTLTENELCLWSIERLPYFAVPRYIEFRQQLPRSPVGKVLKYQLRDDGVTEQTWDIEQSSITLQKR